MAWHRSVWSHPGLVVVKVVVVLLVVVGITGLVVVIVVVVLVVVVRIAGLVVVFVVVVLVVIVRIAGLVVVVVVLVVVRATGSLPGLRHVQSPLHISGLNCQPSGTLASGTLAHCPDALEHSSVCWHPGLVVKGTGSWAGLVHPQPEPHASWSDTKPSGTGEFSSAHSPPTAAQISVWLQIGTGS